MKKVFFKISLLSVFFTLVLVSCGPSKEEEEREIKKEDSLADIQSNEAIERANQLLESDSLSDTTKKLK